MDSDVGLDIDNTGSKNIDNVEAEMWLKGERQDIEETALQMTMIAPKTKVTVMRTPTKITMASLRKESSSRNTNGKRVMKERNVKKKT